jgi:hypothetical protein
LPPERRQRLRQAAAPPSCGADFPNIRLRRHHRFAFIRFAAQRQEIKAFLARELQPDRALRSWKSAAVSPPEHIKSRSIAALGAVPRRNQRRKGHVTPQVAASERCVMNGLIYLVGLIVVILAILSFLGLH